MVHINNWIPFVGLMILFGGLQDWIAINKPEWMCTTSIPESLMGSRMPSNRIWYPLSIFIITLALGASSIYLVHQSGVYMNLGYFPSLLLLIFLSVSTGYDLRYGLIPDKAVYLTCGLIITYNLNFLHGTGFYEFIPAIVFLVALLLLNFGFRNFRNTDAIGKGDVKIVIVLALFLGWTAGWVLYLSLLLAGLFAIPGLVIGKLGRKDRIPLAPFILLGLLLYNSLQSWFPFV